MGHPKTTPNDMVPSPHVPPKLAHGTCMPPHLIRVGCKLSMEGIQNPSPMDQVPLVDAIQGMYPILHEALHASPTKAWLWNGSKSGPSVPLGVCIKRTRGIPIPTPVACVARGLSLVGAHVMGTKVTQTKVARWQRPRHGRGNSVKVPIWCGNGVGRPGAKFDQSH